MVRWLIRVVHDGIFDGTIFWHIRELWNNASVAKVILTLVALFAKVQISNSTANRSSRTQGTKKLVKLEIHFVETDHRCSECHEWKPFPPRYFQYSRECVYIDNIKEKVSSSKNQDRKQTHVRLNDATRTNYSRWISKKFIFSKKKKHHHHQHHNQHDRIEIFLFRVALWSLKKNLWSIRLVIHPKKHAPLLSLIDTFHREFNKGNAHNSSNTISLFLSSLSSSRRKLSR